MVRFETQAFVMLVMLAVLIAGCNVYEGLYEEGESDNPEVLYDDARIALQQDRPAEAVEHLRKALAFTPDSDVLLRKQIQIKLASAVLQVQEINALSLTRIVDTFNGASAGGDGVALGKSHSQTCLFPQSHARLGFDPTEDIDFDRLGSPASQQVLDESLALIARVFSGDETSANPTFRCDDPGLDEDIAALQAQGLSNEEIAEALIDFAVAHSTVAYIDIVNAGGDDASFFYVTPPAGDDYIGLCFSNEQTCNSTVAQTTANVNSLDCSTRVLEKRATLLSSTAAHELATLAREGYQNMNTGLEDTTCIVY